MNIIDFNFDHAGENYTVKATAFDLGNNRYRYDLRINDTELDEHFGPDEPHMKLNRNHDKFTFADPQVQGKHPDYWQKAASTLMHLVK